MTTAGRNAAASPVSPPVPDAPPRPAPVTPPSAAVIAQVRSSCAAVADRPVALADAFYQHLFDMAPHTRAMFPPDMTGQMQKMSDTLLTAITTLAGGDTAELQTVLRRLGAQHRTHYQVAPQHYRYIGHALTRAVRDLSGPLWSGTLSSAWIAVYQWVATHMIDGSATDLTTRAPTPIPTTRPAPDSPVRGVPAQGRHPSAR